MNNIKLFLDTDLLFKHMTAEAFINKNSYILKLDMNMLNFLHKYKIFNYSKVRELEEENTSHLLYNNHDNKLTTTTQFMIDNFYTDLDILELGTNEQ